MMIQIIMHISMDNKTDMKYLFILMFVRAATIAHTQTAPAAVPSPSTPWEEVICQEQDGGMISITRRMSSLVITFEKESRIDTVFLSTYFDWSFGIPAFIISGDKFVFLYRIPFDSIDYICRRKRNGKWEKCTYGMLIDYNDITKERVIRDYKLVSIDKIIVTEPGLIFEHRLDYDKGTSEIIETKK